MKKTSSSSSSSFLSLSSSSPPEQFPLIHPSEKSLTINAYDRANLQYAPITTRADYDEEFGGSKISTDSKISKISKNETVSAGNEEGLRVVGPLRLASILFFMAYGGSYGVEGTKQKKGRTRKKVREIERK